MNLAYKNRCIYGEDHDDPGEVFEVGDKVTWNVYGWHTGVVTRILKEDFLILGRVLYKAGTLEVLCDCPWYEGQRVYLDPDRTVRKIK